MKKRGLQFKTYGRSTAFSKATSDFDKVFNEERSAGNSPFGTSDSSTGRSLDLTDSLSPAQHYDLRTRPLTLCDSLRDISKESSRDDPITPGLKPLTRASHRNKGRGKRKKVVAMDEKENTGVPDYDAIAEDSFVVEKENKMAVTKCSTPLANMASQGSGEIPTVTPIFQVQQSGDYLDDSKIHHSSGIHTFGLVNIARGDHSTDGKSAPRRSSRLTNKLITSRKLLIEDEHKILSLTPDKNVYSQYNSNDHASLYSLSQSLHDKRSMSVSAYENDNSEDDDDVLRHISQNISRLAAINLSVDDFVVQNTNSPLQNGPDLSYEDSKSDSCNFPFNASNDLFCSDVNSNLEGLSCIAEEDSVCEDSLHSTKYDSYSSSKSLLYRLSTHGSEQQTAKSKLFAICEQEDYVSFSSCIPARMMNTCLKIGEGVYGEVFRSVSLCDQNVALKIIPMEGAFNVNDCPQKTYEELLPEAVIAKELSDLACGFCQVNRISCVQGSFPLPLLKQWDEYAKRTLSENDRPDIFPKDQLFAVFEFADGGAALEKFEMSNHKESLSVLRQVVFALAVAENCLEFEHRDLHIGNVLVRRQQGPSTVRYTLDGEEVEFDSEGVVATIIDFTISRLKKDGCAVFCDVSTDDGLFEGSGDIQFDVYRDMRKANGNDWSQFCPYSNVMWVHYLCKKLLTVIKVKDTGREHRDSLRHLRQLNEKILKYESCYHLSQDVSLWQV